jgi:uridine kinase
VQQAEDLDLTVLPQTHQVQVRVSSLTPSCLDAHNIPKGIHTILRNKDCSRRDFIFFIDRLSTLLVEYALQHLPYVPKTVVTPVGVECHGKKSDARVRLSYCYFRADII